MQPYATALVNLAANAGLQPKVTSTVRTYGEQKRLYENFLNGRSRYPAAPPGTSAHEFGFALDLVVNDERYLAELGQVWMDAGGVWHQSDPIHFEFPGFSAPQSDSLGYRVATTAAGFLLPAPLTLGITFGQFARDHPTVAWMANQLIGMGLPITDLWDLELSTAKSMLPKWASDVLGL